MRALDRIAGALGRLAAWGFVLAAAITVTEVALRYGLGAPTTWAHEVTKTLCALGFAFGGAYCMAEGRHIRVTVFAARLGPRGRRALEGLALVTGTLYLAGFGAAASLMAWRSAWRFDWEGAWSPERTPGPPNLPLPAILKAGLALGTLLFLAVVLAHLAAHARGRRPVGLDPEAPSLPAHDG